MPKKSIFAQLEARAVPPHNLLPSPRYQNPGLFKYAGKFWLAYRYHRMETETKRSGIGICEINVDTGEPIGKSQHLPLTNATDSEHHEDCRLFTFKEQPYISFTEMQGYVPGINYTCVMKYARLKLTRNKWSVVEEWKPTYGNNNGFSKEKNWVFFEHADKLYCVYATDPEHAVLRIEGEKVVEEIKTPGPLWQWGHVRGGSPPIDLGDGRMLALFHSSIPTEEPPHFVRYYAGAYTFESKPPFKVLQISSQPIMSGSEEDGHKVDPRYVHGWKPYVVFPCGLVKEGDNLIASFGVNDWQCAVGKLKMDQLLLAAADGSSFKSRYFTVPNGTLPVRYIDAHQRPNFLHWEVVSKPGSCSAGTGYMNAANAREAVEVSEQPGVTEISGDEYAAVMRKLKAMRR